MKNIKCLHILLLLLVAVVFGCSTNPNKANSEKGNQGRSDQNIGRNKKVLSDLPTLDFSKEYPKTNITLQDVADVEYVVLETNNKALLSAFPMYITTNKIVTYNLEGTISIFDRTGKYLHSFNHKGQSGEEYGDAISIAVDDKEIFVVDFRRKAIRVYNYQGKYQRSLKLPARSVFLSSIYNYDDEFLLGDDKYMIDTGKDELINRTPYCKISKKTGKLIPLPLKFDKRIRDELVAYIDGLNSIGAVFNVSPIATFDSGGLIADFTLDTAYIYRNDALIPIAVRTNYTSKKGNPIIATVDFLTDRYQFWIAQEKAIDFKTKATPEPKFYWIDKTTNNCCEVDLQNSDGVDWEDVLTSMSVRLSANIHMVPKNCAAQIYKAEMLSQLYSEGKLKGKLKEIASKLKEDDNPILMIAKFKE